MLALMLVLIGVYFENINRLCSNQHFFIKEIRKAMIKQDLQQQTMTVLLGRKKLGGSKTSANGGF